MNNIDLKDYTLIKPTSIKKFNKKCVCYDIEVKDKHNFFIVNENGSLILSHNCDGDHISALLINFFYKWFKETIRQTKLYRLNLPLLSVDSGKNRTYYYTLKDFEKEKNKQNVRYLKGLGSLDLKDWEYAFSNLDKHLLKIKLDNLSDKYINMAFGEDSELRKIFLQVT